MAFHNQTNPRKELTLIYLLFSIKRLIFFHLLRITEDEFHLFDNMTVVLVSSDLFRLIKSHSVFLEMEHVCTENYGNAFNLICLESQLNCKYAF